MSSDAEPSGGMSDTALFNLIAKGMLLGTPFLYVSAVLIALVAGAGTGNAFAIAAVPALFGGVTFGGFVGLMRYLIEEERTATAARSARVTSPPSPTPAATPAPSV